MDTSQPSEDVYTDCASEIASSDTPTRPTTLNIFVDNGLQSPLFPSFLTPAVDIQPILLAEWDKFINHLKSPAQTPGSFLNPSQVTEEQERFANAFTQKLNEFQETGGIASLPTVVNPGTAISTMASASLPSMISTSIPDFNELCRRVAQQQAGLSSSPSSILLCTSSALSTQPVTGIQANRTTGLFSSSSMNTDATIAESVDASSTNPHRNTVSVTLPVGFVPTTGTDATTVQLTNGLRFEITTNSDGSHVPLLRLLGIESPVTESITATSSDLPPGSLSGSLQLRPASGELSSHDSHTIPTTSPRIDNHTRPSSIDITTDQDLGRPLRSSSVSSSSSVSLSNCSPKKGLSSAVDVKEGRLDPTEQSRMRLERKRARNRDAARKCRERKIRLIKNLERDVRTLTEENEALKYRISKSKLEVENLKLFVVQHLENECPAIASKV